jgi:hypothetical protein
MFLRIYIPKTGKSPFPEKLQVLHSMMVQQYAPGKVCLSRKHRLSLARVWSPSAPWGRVTHLLLLELLHSQLLLTIRSNQWFRSLSNVAQDV